jgi:hypothetical protein
MVVDRLDRMDSEMRLLLAAKRRAEEAHAQELAGAEAVGVAAVAQRRELVEKLQRIGVVEGALRELYVVVKVSRGGGCWLCRVRAM